MESFILVDREEWNALLNDLSQFEQKYQLILNKLDATERRLRELGEEKKEEGRHSSQQMHERTLPDGRAEETGSNLLSRFKSKLESFGATARRSQTMILSQNYASCGNCGYWISRPTRFCQRCGGDFGALTCSCGRQLLPTDRFCDRCGRGL